MKTSTNILLMSSLLLAAPAIAGPREVATRSVAIADLDLARPAHRALLDARIRHAADTACGEASPADLAGAGQVRRCRLEAAARARAEAEQAFASTVAARPARTARLDR